MTDADKKAFAEVMAALAENFGGELSRPGLQMRFEALAPYSIEQVKAAAMSILRSRKFLKLPTIAEFVEHIEGGSVEDIAMVEAAKVLQAMKAVGCYKSVVFDNPTTQAVIEQGFGGWPKACGDIEVENEKWFLKDFVKTYGAYSRQGVELHGHLAGMTEIANNGTGFEAHTPPPVLIGDPAKARAVLERGKEQAALGSASQGGPRSVRSLLTLPRGPHARA